ncbi:hypothetical protein ACU1JV_00245 [Paenibacillus sp. T2-29]|uniref:hypothetical protein n=1 Tax=Paenibacillus TaxID=44249 RepID=UPI0039BD1709
MKSSVDCELISVSLSSENYFGKDDELNGSAKIKVDISMGKLFGKTLECSETEYISLSMFSKGTQQKAIELFEQIKIEIKNEIKI